jgi:hypothetical protein
MASKDALGASSINSGHALPRTRRRRMSGESISSTVFPACSRKTRVRFPADVATRSTEQTLYFVQQGLLKRHDYHVEISGGIGAAHTTCPISRSSLALSFRRTTGSSVSSGRPLRNRTGSSRSTWIRLSSSKARAEVVRLTRIEGALRLIFELSPWPPSCPVLKVADLLDN